jgi:translation initiation factor 1 (eIF-1/SUI1)
MVSLGQLIRSKIWSKAERDDRKGAMQPVMLSVKTRQARKTVTHISGLETFGIDVEDFAEVLKKLCAGSASGEFTSILPS